MITVGSDPEKSHYSAADVTFNENACATYTLLEDGKAIDTITLGVPGIHNVYNSLAAIARLTSWESAAMGSGTDS